jgi:hypothetical protein
MPAKRGGAPSLATTLCDSMDIAERSRKPSGAKSGRRNIVAIMSQMEIIEGM